MNQCFLERSALGANWMLKIDLKKKNVKSQPNGDELSPEKQQQ